MSGRAQSLAAGLLSLLFLGVFLAIWHIATVPKAQVQAPADEYAKLLGKGAKKSEGFPTLEQLGEAALTHLKDPLYDRGSNDKGIGIQLAHSLARVGAGYALAILFAVPFGFLIGMSPILYRALNPFIQLMKPISPLAWMPIALYTIKDSSISGVFVIFICSLWPMLINTAFGVASVRRDWLDVARTLEVKPLRKAFAVILPAAAPTILTGMRISIGISWLVIVAAEMLVGGTGVGYYVWNEWNNLDLNAVVFSVLMIGLVGMALDRVLALIARFVAYDG